MGEAKSLDASGTLPVAIDTLLAHHGAPPGPPSTDPFELVLFENVAYLAPDHRRLEAFESLRRTIGTAPSDLLNASRESLEAVTSRGILKSVSAEKLVECAEICVREFGGDVSSVVEEPEAVARRALRRFPGIGESGAERILLFSGKRALLAPDSNGVRVLVRMGLVHAESSYSRTYARAKPVAETLGADIGRMQVAHGLLRVHGKTVCRRNKPACAACPLRNMCAYPNTEVSPRAGD